MILGRVCWILGNKEGSKKKNLIQSLKVEIFFPNPISLSDTMRLILCYPEYLIYGFIYVSYLLYQYPYPIPVSYYKLLYRHILYCIRYDIRTHFHTT